jgi:hypothetical protein
MLKLTLAPVGHRSRIELNGEDISRFFRSVVVRASVDGQTQANLEYLGTVVIEGVAGELRFEQAQHFVTCDECNKVVAGEEQPVKIIDASKFGTQAKEYAPVKA